jgi:hypothetical protein
VALAQDFARLSPHRNRMGTERCHGRQVGIKI